MVSTLGGQNLAKQLKESSVSGSSGKTRNTGDGPLPPKRVAPVNALGDASVRKRRRVGEGAAGVSGRGLGDGQAIGHPSDRQACPAETARDGATSAYQETPSHCSALDAAACRLLATQQAAALSSAVNLQEARFGQESTRHLAAAHSPQVLIAVVNQTRVCDVACAVGSAAAAGGELTGAHACRGRQKPARTQSATVSGAQLVAGIGDCLWLAGARRERHPQQDFSHSQILPASLSFGQGRRRSGTVAGAVATQRSRSESPSLAGAASFSEVE